MARTSSPVGSRFGLSPGDAVRIRCGTIRPAALLLAVAAHLALATVLGASWAGSDSIRESDAARAEPLVHVRLKGLAAADTGARSVPALPLAHWTKPLGVISQVPSDGPAPVRGISTTTPPPQQLKPGKAVHYFPLAELTENPLVLQDIPTDIASNIPDVIPDSVVMELLINGNGGIDNVVIENAILSKAAQQLIKDSFAKVKFRPGKIGTMPVPSRMRIEVALKNAVPVTVTQVH